MQRNILDDQPTSNLLIRKEKKHNLFVFKIQLNVLKLVKTITIILFIIVAVGTSVYLGMVL